MKITAGLSSIDNYERLVKAGADEVFCGFVPFEWNEKYGTLFPLNRREVLYYNVQIGSYEDMKILKRMMDELKVPVIITFNYLYYLEEQYEAILDIMKNLIDIGFEEFIIADIALLLYLKNKGLKCTIHLSGECAEINSLSIDFLNQFNISRYIFHRKNSIEDMEYCIKNNKVKNLEYEAFMLNEKCHFTGAFCSSLHCDELLHLCKVPYEVNKISKASMHFPEVDNILGKIENEEILYDEEDEEYSYVTGSTGCGLCALKNLKKAGVTHLKVVGRGNYIEMMEQDVRDLKKAINLLDNMESGIAFEENMKKELFNNKCSKECYY
ncbi:Collagenase-like protease, PrtC family [Clostridium sp. DSM 8431]|uniref:U32 family peptidase n=1 Tax=Clostridium sp. DSM 8431 TaxID=1761781 RepID=UPI0008EB983D|nr:U32 family peptidase [Clostridium sp. DSM 8431]SFU32625.1 Collagenase-like protease, PrtC family [Clostridium sp. DSM 8431]